MGEVKNLKSQLLMQTKRYDRMIAKKEKVDEELRVMKKMNKDCIVRANNVCPNWHEEHPKFGPYWLGFINYSEFIIYHKCLWPDVKTIVHVTDGFITPFEKSLITKMFFRKGLEFKLIGHIWGRTNIPR